MAQVVSAVAVSPSADTLVALGDTVRLVAEANDANGHAVAAVTEFEWSSSDTLVAVVDSAGLVTSVGEGTTTVAAAAGDVSGSTAVTVTQSAGSVVVSPSEGTIGVGDTLRLVAEAFDDNGHAVDGAAFSWSSSDAGVARVDDTGLVDGVAGGTARITAMSGDASDVAEITVENPDRAALVALYEATDGPNWLNNENWLTDAPLGEWYGVDTDAQDRVVSLKLVHIDEDQEWAFFGLVGSMPPQLGNLTSLEELNLGWNALSGQIPPELGNLAKLRRLDLGTNNLSGPIPPELGNLASLERMDLAWNNLSGPIPPALGNLSRLDMLLLGWNRLSGIIPKELANLTNLSWLVLQRNNLTGPIPPELQNLTNLTDLWLQGNALTGTIPPGLGNLSRLTALRLHLNNLTGSIPRQLGNLGRLRDLWLGGNHLTGPIPPELGNLRSLEHMALGLSSLTGPIPPELGNLHKLVTLDLSHNQLTGPIPTELGNLTELQFLFLSENQLTGSLPLSFTRLENLATMGCRGASSGACVPSSDAFRAWVREVEARGDSHIAVNMPFCDEIDAAALERLYYATNGSEWTRSEGWLEDEDLSRWYGILTDSIGRVAGIDLRGNGLSGTLPEALGHLTGMRALRIGRNVLAGRLPLSLADVPLEEFDYANTSLCAPGEPGFQGWLNGIPQHSGTGVQCPPLTDREILRRFRLHLGGAISGWLVPDMADWPGVKTDAAGRVVELRLPGMDLSGSLSAELALLSELRVLDLGGNFFRGQIPGEFGDLSRLERLDLEGNRLSGGIPGEIGRLSELRDLSLGGNQLSGPVPPEVGELSGLDRLDLAWNHLSGEIPPELASLVDLKSLDLRGNSLSGPILPELGDLGHLTQLRLASNQLSGSIPSTLTGLAAAEVIDLSSNQLSGGIPSQLGELDRLVELNLSDNRMTGSIPAELGAVANLRALRLSRNNLTGSIPARLDDLTNLVVLDLGNNQLTGSIPADLGGLSNLDTLNLGGNALSGPMPAELGRATMLEDLDVRSNALTGPVPPEFGNLTRLKSLILADNPDLAGPLPPGITALDGLERFMAGGTGLCRPADVRFELWFRSIADRRVVRCRVSAAAYLTQTVQSWDEPVPLLAEQPALLRVFVTAPGGGAATMPAVRARFYLDGTERHTVDIASGTQSIPSEIVEGDLALSANTEIPGWVIVPGLEMVIEVDPNGTLDAALGVTRRIPDAGRMAVDVRRVPPLHLTLIPFLPDTEPDSSFVATVTAAAADPNGHELLRGARTLFPAARLDVAAREPVISSWIADEFRLLGQVEAMRRMEGATGYWMGLVGSGRPRGVAYVGGSASVSFADDRIIAHELGHNLSLLHAPCDRPGGSDPWFPYINGTIGAWGYDFEQGALVPPHAADVMSYCTHIDHWISDFFFNKALAHRLASGDAEMAAAAQTTRALMLWGGRDEDGVPYLDPAFIVDAVPSLPTGGGEYSIEAAASDGTSIFSFDFDMPVNPDAEGDETSFVFMLPVQSGWEGNLTSITLSGPTGSTVLDGTTDLPMAILRDPRTGQVRAFLRDPGPLTQTAADAAGQGGGPGMEVLFSRGIPSAEAWRR